jgi:hypothetical protein
MTILSEDTHPEVEALLLAAWRQTTPHEKLDRVFQMRETVVSFAMAGLRVRHPSETEPQLRRRLATLLVGEDLAARAYGPVEERSYAPKST